MSWAGWFKREKLFGNMTLTRSSRGVTRSYKDPMSGVTKTYKSSGKAYTTRTQKADGWTKRTRTKI
jgi:hypothetical protein